MPRRLPEAEDTDGIHVLVKRGSGAAAKRLRAEGETLAMAKHPGVVELVSMHDDAEEVTLRLAHVTGRNLLDQPPLDARQLSAVFAEVAQTLADLHALGVAHTNLGAEHIILDRHLHATLCGFGSACRSDSKPPTNGVLDHHTIGNSARLDVISIGRLLDREVARSLDDQLSEDREPTVIALRHIADLADCATDPARVVEMQQLARRLHQLAGTTSHDPRPASGGGLDRLRDGVDGAGRAVGAVLLAAAIAAIVLATWPNGSSPTRDPSPEPVTLDPSPAPFPPVGAAGTEPQAELILDTRPICEPVAPGARRADVDGDGCDDEWWRVGSVLAAADERYSLGDEDDLVTVGDWDCDGIATPALVDAVTGDVFFFSTWAVDGGSAIAEFATTVALPRTLFVTDSGACDELTVATTTGESHTIKGTA